ncbi:MAG: hypothetical protein FJ387_06520 [Verrucomicrobia bacterium]|nr:hypothetical protein [Verrucomicrobiota bacterium]
MNLGSPLARRRLRGMNVRDVVAVGLLLILVVLAVGSRGAEIGSGVWDITFGLGLYVAIRGGRPRTYRVR